MGKEMKLYGLDGWERLVADVETVVERVIDDACVKAGEPFDAIATRITWPLHVRVFRPMELPSLDRMADHILDNLMEWLDEEHADPDGDPTDPTPAMRKAALVCAKAVRKGYISWSCEPTGDTILVTQKEAQAMSQRGVSS